MRVLLVGAGGARMGTAPDNSVTDRWGRVRNVPTVTGASSFAGVGLTGTTLTVMARTVRACRHLARG